MQQHRKIKAYNNTTYNHKTHVKHNINNTELTSHKQDTYNTQVTSSNHTT